MSKASETERAEAIDFLRARVSAGDTVYTVLRHVSRSGMKRVIGAFVMMDGKPYGVSYSAGKAIRATLDRERDGIVIGGCGFDAGFEIAYSLGHALYPDGFECIGEECRSNDHSNGDRDRTPHHHKDGGYALRHRWL